MRPLLILAALLAVVILSPTICDAATDPGGKWLDTQSHTLGIVTTDSPMPFVAVWEKGKSLPDVAVFIENGKVWLQVRDGKSAKFVPLDKVLNHSEPSPFKPTAFHGRSCSVGNCASEPSPAARPVVSVLVKPIIRVEQRAEAIIERAVHPRQWKHQPIRRGLRWLFCR